MSDAIELAPFAVVALIPAHNEAAGIVQTVESLLSQTRQPDRIIVIADNCIDDTVELARGAGAEVFETVGNDSKKAGALNQVLDVTSDQDWILTMDADTILCQRWIEDTVAKHQEYPDAGAISGTYQARPGKGIISLLQAIEYHQVHRRISRKGGHVYVLSGTATLFRPEVITQLREQGPVFDPESLVEDFDVTLRVRILGYVPRTFKHLITTTDVMETWHDLTRQRLRWQRGTLETLLKYGWRKETWRMWLGQITSYLMTFMFLAIIFVWSLTLILGIVPSLIWLSVTPIFMMSQYVETHRAGKRPTLIAVSLIPMWLYDLFRLWIYWTAALRIVRKTQSVWH